MHCYGIMKITFTENHTFYENFIVQKFGDIWYFILSIWGTFFIRYIAIYTFISNKISLVHSNYNYVGTLVPNSRDQHDKWKLNFRHHETHPKHTLFERKADWSALLILLITLHCYKQSENPNSLTCRGFLRFEI